MFQDRGPAPEARVQLVLSVSHVQAVDLLSGLAHVVSGVSTGCQSEHRSLPLLLKLLSTLSGRMPELCDSILHELRERGIGALEPPRVVALTRDARP